MNPPIAQFDPMPAQTHGSLVHPSITLIHMKIWEIKGGVQGQKEAGNWMIFGQLEPSSLSVFHKRRIQIGSSNCCNVTKIRKQKDPTKPHLLKLYREPSKNSHFVNTIAQHCGSKMKS